MHRAQAVRSQNHVTIVNMYIIFCESQLAELEPGQVRAVEAIAISLSCRTLSLDTIPCWIGTAHQTTGCFNP